MAFSGGVFSRLYNWATEQLSSPIEISKLDAQEEDIATALSNCILRDGTGLPTASIPFNGQLITGLGDAAAATDALNRQTADARYFVRQIAVKTTDTARTSTAVLADDPHLTLAVTSGGVYAFELTLYFTCSSTGDIELMISTPTLTYGWHTGIDVPSNAGSPIGYTMPTTTATAVTATAFTSFAINTIGGASIYNGLVIKGIASVSASGNIKLQWAQDTSDGTATTLYRGSTLELTRVA